MENRKKLRENGLVLIILGIFNVFTFISTVIKSIVDGTVSEALATVEADILVAVKVVLIVICVLMTFLAGADILLGVKGLKVSKKPDTSKGYITAAKIFLILTAIATIIHAISIFSGNATSVVDGSVNAASLGLSACIYALFIKAAENVRKDALNESK